MARPDFLKRQLFITKKVSKKIYPTLYLVNFGGRRLCNIFSL